eukprot:3380977-Pyramimonas_sp.AAC.1
MVDTIRSNNVNRVILNRHEALKRQDVLEARPRKAYLVHKTNEAALALAGVVQPLGAVALELEVHELGGAILGDGDGVLRNKTGLGVSRRSWSCDAQTHANTNPQRSLGVAMCMPGRRDDN